MPFIPHTEEEIKFMLKQLDVDSIEELFSEIPNNLRMKGFKAPDGMSVYDAERYVETLGKNNKMPEISYLGAGFYNHYIPAAVDAVVNRGEFYTAYTPYQPECSQGTLQAIYEFQSAICRLTQLDVANASLYDGGTALVEAVLMTVRCTGRHRIVIDSSVNPIYHRIIKTYLKYQDFEVVFVANNSIFSDQKALKKHIDDDTSAVVVQNPNFFGTVDDFTELIEYAHSKGSLAVLSTYPISLAVLRSAADMGADIAVGEGQSLGLPLSFGGPYLGFLACSKQHIRKMPGRIIGATVDNNGNKGYVMTLQTREQHIRREKATSNICSNEGLCALRALVYMSLLGEQGLKSVAKLSMARIRYMIDKLKSIKGIKVIEEKQIFNECVVKFPCDAKKLINEFSEKGIILGFALEDFYPELKDCVLISTTEKHREEDIDRTIALLKDSVLLKG